MIRVVNFVYTYNNNAISKCKNVYLPKSNAEVQLLKLTS